MENLINKSTEEQAGLILALAIAFPEAKIHISENVSAVKLYTILINNEQFYNLHTILELYKMEISVHRTSAKFCIEISNVKEVSND